MQVYLTGFMGAGKSTVGRCLADLLGWRFVDLDETIEERAGRPIADVFLSDGESEFRRLESAALKSIEGAEYTVVSTGGGAVTVAANREWMQGSGVSVWLDLPFEVLIDRLRAQDPKQRPMFENETQARQLYERRVADYSRADIRVEITASQSAREVAESIRRALGESRCDI